MLYVRFLCELKTSESEYEYASKDFCSFRSFKLGDDILINVLVYILKQ